MKNDDCGGISDDISKKMYTFLLRFADIRDFDWPER